MKSCVPVSYTHLVSGRKNVRAQLGDATALTEVAGGSFDVVLCLGPMYHLPDRERELVFAQCRRILRPGGIAAFAYVNKVGVYAGGCIHDKLRACLLYTSRCV